MGTFLSAVPKDSSCSSLCGDSQKALCSDDHKKMKEGSGEGQKGEGGIAVEGGARGGGGSSWRMRDRVSTGSDVGSRCCYMGNKGMDNFARTEGRIHA